MTTMHFRPLVWKRDFFLSSSQVQKEGLSPKEKTHNNTTPTRIIIKYDSKLSLTLSNSLSSRKCSRVERSLKASFFRALVREKREDTSTTHIKRERQQHQRREATTLTTVECVH